MLTDNTLNHVNADDTLRKVNILFLGGAKRVSMGRKFIEAGRRMGMDIYIMEELHSILSLGAGGSTKMVGGGLIRRAFNAKYPREYIDLAEKRSANLAAFADFYREPEEHT